MWTGLHDYMQLLKNPMKLPSLPQETATVEKEALMQKMRDDDEKVTEAKFDGFWNKNSCVCVEYVSNLAVEKLLASSDTCIVHP